MSDKKINIDFSKIFSSVTYYFGHLSMDIMIAWGVVLLGVILIIVGLMI